MDHQVLLFGNFEVPFIDLLFDPIGEEIFDNRGADVGDPLLWRFGQLEIRFREILVKLWMMVFDHGEDIFNGKSFIAIIGGEIDDWRPI